MGADPLPRCGHCAEEVATPLTRCVVCGRDVGFPNTRFAERPSEKEGLAKRYQAAVAAAKEAGSLAVLKEFEKAVDGSRAVLVMRHNRMFGFVMNEEMIVSFYKQVASGSRLPSNDEWDMNRARNDASVNPHYHDELVPAALSLTDEGISWYGDYDITLKDLTIDVRATVFEENPFMHNDREFRKSTALPEAGRRATWAERAKLAVCKLHPRISPDTSEAEFQDILMEPQHERGDSDFIEVQIYGRIHPRAIERVYAHPKTDLDRQIWAAMKLKLEQAGVETREG
jgi:hypothetical protein